MASTLAISSSAQAITIDFSNVGTSQPASYIDQGVTVTGSANLNILSNGEGYTLGIVGGIDDIDVDTNEFVNFAFAAPVIDLTYSLGFVRNTGGNNSLLGERTLTVFGISGTLGTFNRSGFDGSVSSLVGNAPIQSFRLTSPGFDNFLVDSIVFTQPLAVPFEFSPVGGLVILAGVWLGRKQFKKRSVK